MKKITAIVLLLLMSMLVFTGCKREGEMIETMVSSIFTTDAPAQNNNGTENSGHVTDSDGHIGNETTGGNSSTNSSSSANTDTTDGNIM